MKVKRSERDGVPILHLEGEFDSFETELVRQGFDASLAEGNNTILMDLSGLTFANSTTLAYFITAQKRAKEKGGSLILVQPTEFILNTLRTLGFEQVLTIEDNLEDALAKAQG